MQISSTLATPDALESYTQLASHPLHSSSKPGILSIDIHQTKVNVLLLFTIDVLLYSVLVNAGVTYSLRLSRYDVTRHNNEKNCS